MRRSTHRVVVACACLLAAGVAFSPLLSGQDAAKSTDAAPATQTPKRQFPEIMRDIQKTGQELGGLISSPAQLVDPDKRKEVAPKVLPPLRKLTGYAREMRESGDPRGKMFADQIDSQLTPMLALFGDEPTLANLKKQSQSKDKEEAVRGQSALLLVHWVEASKDAAAQEKLLEEAKKLAAANPTNAGLTGQLAALGELGPATPELADKARDLAAGMNTPVAAQLKEQLADSKKLRELEHKPLVIAGARNDGSQFSTANWKGKVILVDFWATWCGPCRAELPRVKKAYAQWHDKGLEVLGVSCDNNGEELSAFLTQNKDMPWPQLFDSKTPGWHPLATQYGIKGIPTMFLIDKKGVVRSVSARENFEELIPKMLEE